jgi:hypothetical protein
MGESYVYNQSRADSAGYIECARGGGDSQGGPGKKKLKISFLESQEKNVDLMITNSADFKFGFYMTDLITYSCKEKTGRLSQSQISLQEQRSICQWI